MKIDKSIDLLKLLQRVMGPTGAGTGLYIVKVITSEPETTLIFEGTQLPLDLDIFEVPIKLLPLEEGSRYFALPIINGQRWGLIEKLDGNGVQGTFTAGTTTVTVANGQITNIQ